MNQTASRQVTALAAAVAVVLVSGCATGVTGAATTGGTQQSVPGSTPATSIDTGCAGAGDAAAMDPTPEPAGDPAVMIVAETNAWEGATRWTQPVALAVYPGGGAVRPVTSDETGATVPAMEWGRIDSCRLTSALGELSDLVDADFGEPGVTDQGATTITVRTPDTDQPQQIAVYALSVDPHGLTDLTDVQVVNRDRLIAAIDDLQAAVTDPQPWVPDRVRLIGLEDAAGDGQANHPWPVPAGIDASLQRTNPDCVTLDGQSAVAVLGQLGSGPSTATWTDGQRSVSFTATVLVPGQPGCPE